MNCGHGGRAVARRPHQRRGARHPGRLPGRHAAHRRQLAGDVQEGEERAGAQVQGGAVRLSGDKLNKLAHTGGRHAGGDRRVRVSGGPQYHPSGGAQGAGEGADRGDEDRRRRRGRRSPRSARSSSKDSRSGTSSTASTTTTRSRNWACKAAPVPWAHALLY